MKNFTIKKRLMVPAVAVLLILVTALTGCLGFFDIATGAWSYADETGTSVTLSGSVTLLDNPDNWKEGFAWDTIYHDNYSDYANQGYATEYGAFGTFYLTINGLYRGTEYHYRAFGESLLGTTVSQGNDVSFITGVPFCRTDDAIDVALTSCNLTGELTHLGGAASGDVWFEYGLCEESLDYTTPSTTMYEAGGFYAVISGLTSCETVYYRAVVENDLGIGYGSVESVRIGVPVVYTVKAVVTSADKVRLDGAVVEFSGTDTCDVWFEYGDKSSGNLDQVTPTQTLTEPGEFSEFLLDLLEPGTTYWFRAVAFNGVCYNEGDVLEFTTPGEIGDASEDDHQPDETSVRTRISNILSRYNIDLDTFLKVIEERYPLLKRFI